MKNIIKIGMLSLLLGMGAYSNLDATCVKNSKESISLNNKIVFDLHSSKELKTFDSVEDMVNHLQTNIKLNNINPIK